jgi:hypothetical protein
MYYFLWDVRFSDAEYVDVFWNVLVCSVVNADRRFRNKLLINVDQYESVHGAFYHKIYGSRNGQYISIYECICVDILILVYRLCNAIFSVQITKVSKNQQKINPPQPLYLCILLSNRPYLCLGSVVPVYTSSGILSPHTLCTLPVVKRTVSGSFLLQVCADQL